MTSNRYEVDDDIYITNQLSNEDIPSYVKYLNNPTIHSNTLKIPYPYSTNDGEDFIKLIESVSSYSIRMFTIRLNSNNELIGACGFERSIINPRRIELGYWLGEPYWHRGIMPKVVKKAIEIIKNEWKDFIRIEAEIFAWNNPSMRVVEKCGFTFEGILRKRTHKKGQDIDVHSYALIIE
jgi:ribosomal-protein-alanine N-acetyltransferase